MLCQSPAYDADSLSCSIPTSIWNASLLQPYSCSSGSTLCPREDADDLGAGRDCARACARGSACACACAGAGGIRGAVGVEAASALSAALSAALAGAQPLPCPVPSPVPCPCRARSPDSRPALALPAGLLAAATHLALPPDWHYGAASLSPHSTLLAYAAASADQGWGHPAALGVDLWAVGGAVASVGLWATSAGVRCSALRPDWGRVAPCTRRWCSAGEPAAHADHHPDHHPAHHPGHHAALHPPHLPADYHLP